MYCYTILLLRLLGKRSIGQLSTLELAIIICFGSAVGDPMMGKDIPILHGIVVITTVALMQIGAEWVINRNKRLEQFMEGRPDCLVKDGVIVLKGLSKNNLSKEDLFRFLRSKDVEQLGQIKNAFFETSGLVSVWCYAKTDIRPGLSILPEDYVSGSAYIPAGETVIQSGAFSCTSCGQTTTYRSGQHFLPVRNAKDGDGRNL